MMISRKKNFVDFISDNNQWLTIGLSILFTIGIYLRYGYQLGLGDGPEFLPFAKAIQNPALYKKDLFMQSMLGMPWNERTVFSIFFSFFDSLEWAGFIVHALLTFLLILGVYRLCHFFLSDIILETFFVCFYFFITLHIDVGATTLYYHNIQGESFANTLIIWALVAIVYNKYALAYLLIGVATYFHALIGFQSFLYITGAFSLFMIINNNFESLKAVGFSVLTYLILCAWLIVLILLGNQLGSLISDEEFINLTYRFSLKCHFDPSYFSRKGYILFFVCIAAGLLFYKKQQQMLYYIMVTLCIGYIIYVIGFYLNSYLIISSWWFRSNMWIMLLGQIAILALLKRSAHLLQYRLILLTIVFVAAASWAILVQLPIPRMYPWKDLSVENDEVKTAIACKSLSNVDDIFIQPLNFTALKYFGERASYVEYYRILRTKKDIMVWYERLGELYQLNSSVETTRNPDFDRMMLHNYNTITDLTLSKLASKGVKYGIFPLNHNTKLDCIYANDTYKVVRLTIL